MLHLRCTARRTLVSPPLPVPILLQPLDVMSSPPPFFCTP